MDAEKRAVEVDHLLLARLSAGSDFLTLPIPTVVQTPAQRQRKTGAESLSKKEAALPAAAVAGEQEVLSAATFHEKRQRASGLDWAGLLKRTFKVDIFSCAKCGGRRNFGRHVIDDLLHDVTC